MANSLNITKKTLRGISKAQKDYEKWSELWLWQAPEYMITTYIAKEIATDYYVTLEQDAGELRPGPGKLPEDVRRKLEGGRFDIVVWDDDTPIVIIEVKNQPGGFSNLSGDVENICSMVKRGNSVQHGLVAYYAALKETEDGRSGEERTSGRVESIKSAACDYINNKGGLKLSQHSILEVVDDSAWTAVVLQISKTN